ncbi:helix-turn-helix domain-containing protein [Arthrobacter sp. NEB 688]|uniref:helix-turn-helix domain-containing protein n=1 Tax=Arthrobacter sp. NEB 688 TaxID=904039 RepID=UPI0015669E72|nr:helix-turn-helix domain-containing protein [Arthrobacter sp. NEB 688]
MPLTADRHLESLATAARRTGVSVKTLRRRIAAGELCAYRSGRLIRVVASDVDALFVRIPTFRTMGEAAPVRWGGARHPSA